MSIPILDTHQHLIYPDKYPYSWTNDLAPLKGNAFHIEDYLTLTKGSGITRTIFMEASPDDPHWLDETQFVYELSEQPNAIIEGVIANCRPESPSGFEAYIESVQHPKLVGFRRILHTMPDDLSQSDHFTDNIRLLEKYNLTFDLCYRADQLPIARNLAQKCPEVQFILDHCGVPDIANNETDPWRDHIAQIATLPNVACKISGVLAYCAEGNATTKAVRPYVEHCIASFGWNRVVWGSDWPVCNTRSNIQTWVQASREIVADADVADQEKLFHRNAERIYLKKS